MLLLTGDHVSLESFRHWDHQGQSFMVLEVMSLKIDECLGYISRLS